MTGGGGGQMRGCSPRCLCGSTQTGREAQDSLWVRSVLCPMALWVLLKFGLSGGPIGSETRKDVIASSAPLGSSSASGLVRPRGLSDSCPASQRWGGRGQDPWARLPSHAPLPSSPADGGAQLALVFPMFFQLCGMG